MKERKSKASNLEEKLKDKSIRQKLGMNEDLLEDRKQQKYLYSINYNDNRSPEESFASTEQNRRDSTSNRIEFEKNDLEDEKEGDDSDDEEDDDDDKESVLSDISNESTYF